MSRLSLGWRTDLIFPRFDAEVIERADYLLVRTPHNPNFYWGNFLLFDHAPRPGDAARWRALFDVEFDGLRPALAHVAYGVDVAEPFVLPDDFAAVGMTLHASTVLTMRRDRLRSAPSPIAGASFGALQLPGDARAAVELQVAADEADHELAGYRLFRERQMARYTSMQQAGLGHWFGMHAATPEGMLLVAECGLFRDGLGDGTLGRFQHVSTHRAWRRRGLCRALIHAVCRHGFDAMGLDTLVIVADPDDVAIGLYESIGFERGPSTWQIEGRPAHDRG